jgi:two-component system chemotaxis sensor kinase CheA
LPLLVMSEFFNQNRSFAQAEEPTSFWLIVVSVSGHKLGLLADELLGREEIITKPLHKKSHHADDRDLFSGATVLENGEVALLLDLARLLHKTQLFCTP